MRFRGLVWLFVALAVSSGWAEGQSIGIGEGSRVEFELRRWRPNFTSELKVGGDSIYMKEDLGITDPRDFEYKGFLRFGRWVKIRGGATMFKFDTSQTLARDITYNGLTFTEGTNVQTTMDTRFIKGGVEVELLLLREGLFSVFVDYCVFEAEPIIRNLEQTANAGKLEVKLPTIGAKGRVYLTPSLALTAEAEGMKKDGKGVITDFEFVAAYSAGRNFALEAGYRNLYVKWLEEGRATWRFEGFFYGAAIRF
jgi:hypothetical protein